MTTSAEGMNYIEFVLPDIQKASQRVARKWPQATTEEDLYQDLTLHFLERPGSLEELAKLTPEKRLARLVAIGHEKASSARDDFEVFSGQFNYSVDEVRKLAERGAIVEAIADFDVASVDLQASMAVLKKRNRDYWSAIVDRYVEGVKTVRGTNQEKVLQRALDSLTTLMNRARATQKYEFTNGGRYRNSEALHQGDLDYFGAGREED